LRTGGKKDQTEIEYERQRKAQPVDPGPLSVICRSFHDAPVICFGFMEILICFSVKSSTKIFF